MCASEADRIEEIKSHLQDIRSEKYVEDYYLLMKLFELGHADWLVERLEHYKRIADERGN